MPAVRFAIRATRHPVTSASDVFREARTHNEVTKMALTDSAHQRGREAHSSTSGISLSARHREMRIAHTDWAITGVIDMPSVPLGDTSINIEDAPTDASAPTRRRSTRRRYRVVRRDWLVPSQALTARRRSDGKDVVTDTRRRRHRLSEVSHVAGDG